MSKIEWLHPPGYIGVTWNPVTGCTPCSPGCANCYAARMANRLRGRGGYPADDPFQVTVHPDKMDLPRHWKKPRFAFVCSMGDLFHKQVSDKTTSLLIGRMQYASWHRFVLLTKRPNRLRQWYVDARWPGHIFVGVSVSNQEEAVDLRPWLGMLDWVIVGGETGPGARECRESWLWNIVGQCQRAGVPVFVKQIGSSHARAMKWKSRKGADPSEWPGWMRVREFPNGL
jgi:protein gp37